VICRKLVILTKCFMTVADTPDTHPSKLQNPDQKGYVNRHGLSRKHIFAAVDASLERLGLDYIDVLQCHRFVSGLSLCVSLIAASLNPD
jgi:aryl-alcohol dehydrogenase-like predicted oxidoreductase